MSDQLQLFGATPTLPPGFKYSPDIMPAEYERELLQKIKELPFKEFEFHGFLGKRRTVSFGWKYDFGKRTLHKAADIPGFLLELRQVAAEFAGMASSELQQVLVLEYGAGAGIGWHKDKAVFGEVIGISLLAPAQFRLRRKAGDTWDRVSLTIEPRSAYLLSGEVRTEWEHSIPPVDALRYSVTFRNLRDDR
ncbi:MAG TPA: alpha-ketoglutarate-dependent dioxygenase AlkB [Gemmatimonadaceae bacterium]|nr:alpha-ketoglutarate-dependent dioxygenase AlkB [Gemmatimonadaceae bacterium]